MLFGIQLIISGIFRLVGAFATDDLTGGTRVLLALLALIVFLGIFWVVNGVIEIFTALSHREIPQRGWTVAMGVLSILAGIIVLAYPGLSLYGQAIILGIWLLIFGAVEMAAAFRLRSAAHAAPGMA